MRRRSRHRYTATMNTPTQQAGITLIEVLIAAALAGFALLALAMLHSQSLRGMEQAQHNVEANLLLQDLASRMQANPAGRISYTSLLGTSVSSQGCSSSNSSDPATPCTPSQLAEHDVWMWQNLVSTALGTATGSLAVLSTNDTSYRLTLTWTEDGAPTSASLAFRLRSSAP